MEEGAEPVAPLRKVKKKGKKGKQVYSEAVAEGQAPPVPGGKPRFCIAQQTSSCELS